ncbi:hypothetical protein SEPCBS119000_002316 [Sporothrix epigloea]|uniref:FAD-binding FR-type domain-containing protein n=1 Tax=Sporothrix epigloea TaxID=1892477 RepID=A0ABP0DJ08_9PEZI
MSDIKESHEERTAHAPREAVRLTVEVQQFRPGQWVDTFCPGITKAGGFTITSTPTKATSASPNRYIELSVKVSPENPVAAWLWQDERDILGQFLQVRVGGSFIFPPPKAPPSFVKDPSARVVFIAGGVGINPLVSMVAFLGELNMAGHVAGEAGDSGCEVIFLYSVRAGKHQVQEDAGEDGDKSVDVAQIPFLQRLTALYKSKAIRGHLKLFVTGGSRSYMDLPYNRGNVSFTRRRITTTDLDAAILDGDSGGGRKLEQTFVYICGVPTMTDAFIQHLTGKEGPRLAAHAVLCEKWW